MADRMFDWNDVIENDSSFTLLPEGRYPFTVVSFERAEHAGSDKIPPCKKAVLTIELDGGALGSLGQQLVGQEYELQKEQNLNMELFGGIHNLQNIILCGKVILHRIIFPVKIRG